MIESTGAALCVMYSAFYTTFYFIGAIGNVWLKEK